MNPTHLLWVTLRGVYRGLAIDDAPKGTVWLRSQSEVDRFVLEIDHETDSTIVAQGTLDEVLAYAKKKRWSLDR